MLPTIILRHKKENLKKCSLTGLEKKQDLLFFTYPLKTKLPDLSSYAVLSVNGPELLQTTTPKAMILIDGTWKYAEKMQKLFDLPTFSLPKGFKTAYPRKQTACPNPERGLASVEALFLAYLLSGRNVEGLLDHYYWKEEFLSKNSQSLQKYPPFTS